MQSDLSKAATAVSGSGRAAGAVDEGLREHMTAVYSTMGIGLLVTAGVAWSIGSNEALLASLQGSALYWVVLLAPLGMILGLSRAFRSFSAQGLRLFFYVFSALLGASMSTIFAVYTTASIGSAFFATAAAFAGLSIYGYTTKRDLGPIGTFLVMGLVGLIIAMIANIFLASSALSFAISMIGVLIFAGLTAADTQEIKNRYLEQRGFPGSSEDVSKLAILGALSLYLDFINLFQHLLAFMGERGD